METKLRKYTTEIWIYNNYDSEYVKIIISEQEKLTGFDYFSITDLYFGSGKKVPDIKERLNYSITHIRNMVNDIIKIFHALLLDVKRTV